MGLRFRGSTEKEYQDYQYANSKHTWVVLEWTGANGEHDQGYVVRDKALLGSTYKNTPIIKEYDSKVRAEKAADKLNKEHGFG